MIPRWSRKSLRESLTSRIAFDKHSTVRLCARETTTARLATAYPGQALWCRAWDGDRIAPTYPTDSCMRSSGAVVTAHGRVRASCPSIVPTVSACSRARRRARRMPRSPEWRWLAHGSPARQTAAAGRLVGCSSGGEAIPFTSDSRVFSEGRSAMEPGALADERPVRASARTLTRRLDAVYGRYGFRKLVEPLLDGVAFLGLSASFRLGAMGLRGIGCGSRVGRDRRSFGRAR